VASRDVAAFEGAEAMAKKSRKAQKARKVTTKKAVKAPARRPAKAARAAAPAAPSAKMQFLAVLAKEHPTTMKVMKAFPAAEGAFQPHPRSHSAKRLMWTFVMEQAMIMGALKGTLKMPPSFPPEPDTLAEVMAAYDRGAKELSETIAKASDARLTQTVPFFVGPGQMGDVPVIDLMWMMLMDSIHHRGQLSVYNRMAGGKVPAIYGPSADEPWN
jgi:uncharacterized damage-inducible protein DinB